MRITPEGIHSYSIHIPFKFHSYSIHIPFKFHSYSIQIPFKFHSNSIQIPFKFHSYSIQIPFKFHSYIPLISIYIILYPLFISTISPFLIPSAHLQPMSLVKIHWSLHYRSRPPEGPSKISRYHMDSWLIISLHIYISISVSISIYLSIYLSI